MIDDISNLILKLKSFNVDSKDLSFEINLSPELYHKTCYYVNPVHEMTFMGFKVKFKVMNEKP